MDHDILSIISDYDFDGATTIQNYWWREAASTKVSRWKPYLILRASRRKAAVALQRRWICTRFCKKIYNLKNALVVLQAHARHKA